MEEKEQAADDPRFNVDEWLDQIGTAMSVLDEEERNAINMLKAAEQDLAKIRAKKERVKAVATAAKMSRAAASDGTSDGSSRRSGVLDLAKRVMSETPDSAETDRAWSEQDLVEKILREDPMMLAKSIQGALRRLCKDGEWERIGKRGAYRYRRTGVDQSERVERASAPDRLHSALVSAGRGGSSLKDLAWILGDEEKTMLTLDDMLSKGDVETFPVGDGKIHYRLVEKSGPPPAPAGNLFGAERPEV